MTREEQVQLINEIMKLNREDLLKALSKVPLEETKEWDGHELRVLVADWFKESAIRTLIRRNPRSARTKSFRKKQLLYNL